VSFKSCVLGCQDAKLQGNEGNSELPVVEVFLLSSILARNFCTCDSGNVDTM
jgi:hypothetical protein